MECKLVEPHFAYVAPTYSQAKDIAWNYLKRFTSVLPGIETNEAELRADLPNGARIRLYGAENYDRMRGIYLDGVVLDEYGMIDPRAWPEVIRPALSDRKGWADFIGTPNGFNHFHEVYEVAGKEPGEWYRAMHKASETGLLDAAELADARKTMTPEQYAQEYECFQPDAMVACHDRVKPISQIVPGDSVLTHTGRMRRVDNVMSREYAGDMVRITAYGSRDIVCTPEHPIYIASPSDQTYAWKNAVDIQAGEYLVMPRMQAATPVITEALARIIGWYTCEGSVSGNAVSFSMGAHEPAYLEELTGALAALGFDAKATNVGSVTSISVASVELCDFLVGQCGSLSHNKRLPLSLIRGREDVLWDALFKGDGCIHHPPGRARPVYSYCTVSEGLAQQVQILGAALGYTGSYTARENTGQIMGREVTVRTAYTVQMRAYSQIDAHNAGQTRMAKNGALGMVRMVSLEPYAGPVHNIAVQGDESYVVNGRAVHNCSFQAAVIGSYFGREMAYLEAEKRIGRVPWETQLPVHTAWDLGIGDATAIWFVQQLGREVRWIDFIENSGVGLAWYANELRSRPYAYGEHILPHDAQVRELGSGESRVETLRALGINPRVVPVQRKEDSINGMRNILSRSWFDAAKCARGLQALKQYRRAFDEKRKVYQDVPYRDWTTHAADAAATFAMGQPKDRTAVKLVYSNKGIV